jgi:hypothetical protein
MSRERSPDPRDDSPHQTTGSLSYPRTQPTSIGHDPGEEKRYGDARSSTSRETELSPFGWHAGVLVDARRRAFRSVRVAAIPTSDPTVPQFFEAAARLPESTPARAKRFLPQSALLGRYLKVRNDEHAAARVGSIATHTNRTTIPVMVNKSRPSPPFLPAVTQIDRDSATIGGVLPFQRWGIAGCLHSDFPSFPRQ